MCSVFLDGKRRLSDLPLIRRYLTSTIQGLLTVDELGEILSKKTDSNYADRIIESLGESDMIKMRDQVTVDLDEMCCHEWVTDVVDQGCESCAQIKYCMYCENNCTD